MPKSWKDLSVEELEREVEKHNRLYFFEHKPVITDEEFDLLVEELKARKPGSKVLSEIGSDLTPAGVKVVHSTPMLSLDKCYEDKTLNDWAAKFEGGLTASPKIDGLAVSLKYGENGTLIQAATRGNGIEGEEITPNVKFVKDIPNDISQKNIEVRGEIYMPLSVFKDYRDQFANPRNLAAGAVKQKDPRKTGAYRLSFFAYDVLGSKASTETEKRDLLQREGFPLVETVSVDRANLRAPFDAFVKKRDDYDFETDGVVYKVDRVDEQERLGSTSHHPRYAIAYKFQGDSEVTRLKDVEWSVSRTGAITPVAIVEPVVLSGATVTRASLHNVGMMKKLGVTKGAKVLMMRRGGVIPNLERVIEGKGKPVQVPARCPSCGSPTELRDDFLYCTNPKSCVKSKIGELGHFIKTIECDGFGEKLIEQLYENSLVTDPSEFYTLTKDQLMRLERMGDTLATKLLRNIEEKRGLDLDVFLRSLGIRELGKHASKILAGFGTLERVLKLDEEELSAIHTIGDVIAHEVVSGLKTKKSLIDRLLKQVKVRAAKVKKAKGALAGKSFLFTGAMLAMERKEAQRLVEEKGGEAAQSVTNDLDYLVVGDGGGAGSKLQKAEKLQKKGGKVKIVGEKDFLKMIK